MQKEVKKKKTDTDTQVFKQQMNTKKKTQLGACRTKCVREKKCIYQDEHQGGWVVTFSLHICHWKQKETLLDMQLKQRIPVLKFYSASLTFSKPMGEQQCHY